MCYFSCPFFILLSGVSYLLLISLHLDPDYYWLLFLFFIPVSVPPSSLTESLLRFIFFLIFCGAPASFPRHPLFHFIYFYPISILSFIQIPGCFFFSFSSFFSRKLIYLFFVWSETFFTFSSLILLSAPLSITRIHSHINLTFVAVRGINILLFSLSVS